MNKKTDKNIPDDALDFAPDILEIQEKPPAPMPRTMLWVLFGHVAILIVWAIIGRVDVVATAEGKLVPKTYVKIVQPADSGIVKDILIKEGQVVAAGQILMKMDPQLSEADSKIVENELALKGLLLRRIDAELANKPLKFQEGDNSELFRQIEAQYLSHTRAYQDSLNQERASLTKAQQDLGASMQVQAKLTQILPTYEAQEAAWQKLGKDGFAPSLMVMDKRRERIEKEQDLKAQEHNVRSLKAAINQTEQRISQVESNYRQQLQNERVETEAAYQKLRQENAKQAHKQGLLELKAPQAGIVKDLATHTVGTVVSPGTILMTLVPINEPLQAEVQVKNEDVGFVREGQQVKIKFAAYPFQKYGMVEGKVIHVSADASDTNVKAEDNKSRQQPSVYKALIELQTQILKTDGKTFRLTPGMQVVAEVNQGNRTVFEYILSPVQGAFHEAGRER